MSDLISRQDAIDALKNVLVSEELEYALPALKKVPSAQQERKVGKWLSRENEPKHQTWWTCSRCTGIFDYKWKYCPNCGAYMRERKEE